MTGTTKHPTKALVLGGGGITTTAWELGLIVGLHDGGAEVTDADVVVGTSAGAIVGAQITSSLSLEELYALQLKPVEGTKEAVVPPNLAELRRVMAAGRDAPDPQTARARIGGAALAATTISEAERLEMIADRLPVQQWPKQRLVLNAVDAQTGAWVTFDQQTGVPLVLAVAASCAVPGIYPPTTIDGHRYMDGGMSSGTNADLARGYDRVLILFSTTGALSTSAGQRDPIHWVTFDDELAMLKQAGAHVLVLTPDEASAAASGPNLLDASRRALSVKAGRVQGRELAESVKRFWGE
jgi:NTE family protein